MRRERAPDPGFRAPPTQLFHHRVILPSLLQRWSAPHPLQRKQLASLLAQLGKNGAGGPLEKASPVPLPAAFSPSCSLESSMQGASIPMVAGSTSHGTLPSRPAVVTLYPYTGQKDNELSFSEGTVICITRRYSDGWCEGVSSEGSGFFPGNYVEPSC